MKRVGAWGYNDEIANACSNATNPNHRIGPSSYIARQEWVERLTKTHMQRKCPKCELFVMWVPRKRAVGKMGLSGNLHVDERDVS